MTSASPSEPTVAPAAVPVFLNLAGRPVAVIGGGKEAAARIRPLLAAGACLHVFADSVCADLGALAAAGRVAWRCRPPGPDDLRGVRLCVVALDDADAAAAACTLARAAGVLVDAVGRPELCDVIVPAPPNGAAFAPRGRASLVGAGPGDPELLTLRAVRALRSADVVLHDALIDPAVLDLARPDARRIDVGKRCGRHAMQQAAINRLIIRHAAAGRHVVRLKGGDPFIFGRGGEELAELRAAGIDVEVIPGVTAACAAAASLGIPLTHRDVARALHLVTGHGSDGALPRLAWRHLAAGEGTIAAYMAGRTIDRLALRLIAEGLPGSTPAVAVENASRPGERHVHATLAELPAALAAARCSGPVLVLIGKVVRLARALPAAERHVA